MLEMVLSCVDGSVYATFFRLMLIVTETGHVSGLLARYRLPLALMKSAYRVPNQTRCLIPWFDGAIYSLEWKEALWDKFVMVAPRPRTPSEQQYSDRKLRTRR